MTWLTQGYRDDNFLSSISFSSSSSSSQMKVSCYVLQLLITWVGNLTSQSLPSWMLGETDIWILKEDSMPNSANPLSIIIIKKLEKKSNVGKSLTRERYNTWRCSPVLQLRYSPGLQLRHVAFNQMTQKSSEDFWRRKASLLSIRPDKDKDKHINFMFWRRPKCHEV